MTPSADRRRASFRRLALAAAAATVALVALGGVVRVTGSGMGCGDEWPLCHGRLIPPLDAPTLIEWSHRLAASLVGLLVAALAALAWARHRRDVALRRPASLALALLVFQILLGAVTVRLALPAAAVVLHLVTAMLLVATLAVAVLRAGAPASGPASGFWRPGREAASPSRRLGRACLALGFVTLVLGGLVANLGAGPACRGFPLCNGALLPGSGGLAWLHWLHRLLAFTLLALLAAAWLGSRRSAPAAGAFRRTAAVALGLALLQVGLGAAMVLLSLPPAPRALHLGLGTLVWVSLVGLHHHAGHVGEAPRREGATRLSDAPAHPLGAMPAHPSRARSATGPRRLRPEEVG